MSSNHPSSTGGRGASTETCQDIRGALPAYATSIALERRDATLYPHVAAHVAGCAICREELDELCILTRAAYNVAFVPAASYPRPDLSFLRPAPRSTSSAPRPWHIDKLGRLIITFSQTLIDVLHQPSLAGAMRGQPFYSYTLDQGELPQCNVVIEVMHVAEELGRVQVCVESLTHDPLDQPPHHVVLVAEDMTCEGSTDAVGAIAFDQVPLAVLSHLHVAITPHREV